MILVVLSAAKDLLVSRSRSLAALGMTALLMAAAPHPIHTTVLELRWDARSNVVEGTLRVFEDDLLAESRREGVSTYVLRHVALTAGGTPVPLQTCGERRAADAVLICLRGQASSGSGWRVRNTILFDRFEDQVNIVRIELGSARTFLLTRRSSTQAIP